MKRVPLIAVVVLLALTAWFFSLERGGHSGGLTSGRPSLDARHAGGAGQPDTSAAGLAVDPNLRRGPGLRPFVPASGFQMQVIAADRRKLPIDPDYVRDLTRGPDEVRIPAPGGRVIRGTILQRFFAADGSPTGVDGRVDSPDKGRFNFRLQPPGDLTGPVTGFVIVEGEEIAYRILPDGNRENPALTELRLDEVICVNYGRPPARTEEAAVPEDHPVDIPIPGYQNGVVPLQSRPSATGVLYLDFDGEKGVRYISGYIDYERFNLTSAQIKNVWERVAEDYAPFELNVTTDLEVFLRAPENARQRCIITATDTSEGGVGGYAQLGSFNSMSDVPCFSFYGVGKDAAEVISHEFGHALGLLHHGYQAPGSGPEGYYSGHGGGNNSWAPIMGTGYTKSLTQWSKAEYRYATAADQDDILIIGTANNQVAYRADDTGADLANAIPLEIFGSGTVHSTGNIESRQDIDAFRVATSGGVINLSFTTTFAVTNLDYRASIHNAAGASLQSVAADAGTPAQMGLTLAAGEYTIRVEGVGRGDPLGSGYTDYGSLGTYRISGTIIGARGPDRVTVNENSSPGTTVGVPTRRNNHGSSPLVWAITAGNTSSAFSIHPSTGVITTNGALDYEGLSNDWSNPPVFDLTVRLTNTVSSTLSESLRVVIAVGDVNEAPVPTGFTAISVGDPVPETSLGRVTVADPDLFDAANFEIVGGNASGHFQIDSSGHISARSGFGGQFSPAYELLVRVSDSGAPALFSQTVCRVTILMVSPVYEFGQVVQTNYLGINGSAVVALTNSPKFPLSPSGEFPLGEFAYSLNFGVRYGATIRAWMVAPHTGKYRFWVAGDDSADLYLNTSPVAEAVDRIAYASSVTNEHEWTKYPSQQSVEILLAAGQICYLEGRHKTFSATGHMAAAWEIRDPTSSDVLVPRQVIPAKFLAPHRLNYFPVVSDAALDVYRTSYSGSTITTHPATEVNPGQTVSWSIEGGNEAGIFGIEPQTGRVFIADSFALASHPGPSVPLVVGASDDGIPRRTALATLTMSIRETNWTNPVGLLAEYWLNLPQEGVLRWENSASGYPERPDWARKLATIDTQQYWAEHYQARIRGYVVPPVTGAYTFYLGADDIGSLRLSPNAGPDAAAEIINLGAPVPRLSYDIEPTAAQTSAQVQLVAGQRYFIEARVRERTDNDFVAVWWSEPTSLTTRRLIADSHMEPYDSNVPPGYAVGSYAFELHPYIVDGAVAGTVVATDAPFEEIRYAILSGNTGAGFAINPETGAIRVADESALVRDSTYQLTVGAQDSGHGRNFAPRSRSIAVSILVPPPEGPPVFAGDPVELGSFTVGHPLGIALAPYVSDPLDTLTFSLVSGPAWLSLSSAGVLAGTPLSAHFGDHLLMVSVADTHGNTVTGRFSFTVVAEAGLTVVSFTPVDGTLASIYGTIASGGTTANTAASDSNYLALREARTGSNPNIISRLEYVFDITTLPNRAATLRVEAYHSANTEGDDFRFSISTNGGTTYTDAILVTKTVDDHMAQTFNFTTGASGVVKIKVVDLDRTPGNSGQQSLFIDLLGLEFGGNTPPSITPAAFEIVSSLPLGSLVGQLVFSDPDAGQTLELTTPRGNEAGLFAISPAGRITVAGSLPGSSTFHELVVVATDNGFPPLANYAEIRIAVAAPLAIAAGQTFVLPEGVSLYSSVTNHGKIVAGKGRLRVLGGMANYGTLRLAGDALLDPGGIFTNSGVLDLIHWQGSLPAGFVNTGAILDLSAVRITSRRQEGSSMIMGIAGYDGHLYRLETTADFGQPWTPVGNAVPGTGTPADPQMLEFNAPEDGEVRFFRVRVHPAEGG